MSLPFWKPSMRQVLLSTAALLVAAGVASGQSATSADSSSTSGYSSSQAGLSASGLQLAAYALPEASDPGGSSAARGGGGQYGNGGNGGGHGFLRNRSWTFEVGGGFNAPVGQDTNESGVVSQGSIPVITWGGNFTGGGGLRFNNRFSVLAEYQFIDDKLPGVLISDVNTATGGTAGITAGNTHINSITGSPVIDLTPKRSNGAYVVGGFGWYHKSTNFQSPEPAFSYYGYYYENVTVASFTSNQWGVNGGGGLYHRFGGSMYGDTSHTELFAEARYLYIHTPPSTQSNGLGTTSLIPVTLGIRF